MSFSNAQTGTAPRAGLWLNVRDSVRGVPRDYTTGTIGRAVVLLAIPMVLEMGDVPFAAEVGESGRLLCTPILSSDVATFLRGAGRDELMKRVGQRGHLAKPAHATKLLFCLEDR